MKTGEYLAELLENTDVKSLSHLRRLRAAINAHEDYLMSGPSELQRDLFGVDHEASYVN